MAASENLVGSGCMISGIVRQSTLSDSRAGNRATHAWEGGQGVVTDRTMTRWPAAQSIRSGHVSLADAMPAGQRETPNAQRE